MLKGKWVKRILIMSTAGQYRPESSMVILVQDTVNTLHSLTASDGLLTVISARRVLVSASDRLVRDKRRERVPVICNCHQTADPLHFRFNQLPCVRGSDSFWPGATVSQRVGHHQDICSSSFSFTFASCQTNNLLAVRQLCSQAHRFTMCVAQFWK